MKIILSRKGFDSASGGGPSPIFPDGTMLSLPIPDKRSRIRFEDIRPRGRELGTVVSDLTAGHVRGSWGAHLDPDLDATSLPRQAGWRPLLGQVKAAQGHLKNQGVGAGDIFLFFGLFRRTSPTRAPLQFDPHASTKHVLWGWLQIDRVISVDDCDPEELPWARYHPHFHREPDASNTLYVAKERLSVPGREESTVRGAGVFAHYSPALQLTRPGAGRAALWQLPSWFYPDSEREPLTYHAAPHRWKREDGCVLLETVGRGQEFILDCSYYPEAPGWLNTLLNSGANP
jgi:hypothetical protein